MTVLNETLFSSNRESCKGGGAKKLCPHPLPPLLIKSHKFFRRSVEIRDISRPPRRGFMNPRKFVYTPSLNFAIPPRRGYICSQGNFRFAPPRSENPPPGKTSVTPPLKFQIPPKSKILEITLVEISKVEDMGYRIVFLKFFNF